MSQPALFKEQPVARARSGDRNTSRYAAQSFTAPMLNAIQTEILAYFRMVKQATDEEMEQALARSWRGSSTLRSRRAELVDKGLLRDSGLRRKNIRKKEVIIWELVESRPAVRLAD